MSPNLANQPQAIEGPYNPLIGVPRWNAAPSRRLRTEFAAICTRISLGFAVLFPMVPYITNVDIVIT
jgi:hypothetical protein